MYVPIIPTKEYNPRQIAENGWIKNTKEKKDYRFVLALIKAKQLRARNVCLTGEKYYKILGTDLLRYLNSGTYTIPNNETNSNQIIQPKEQGLSPENR
jgi:hypothetical protein